MTSSIVEQSPRVPSDLQVPSDHQEHQATSSVTGTMALTPPQGATI